MAFFGIPYMGSKSKIATDLIKQMPSGGRFVDLFGGGFAMSHCAFLSGLYSEVYYNDINPLLVPLIQDAIDGKYNYDVFTPKFITKKEFHDKKDCCGYVKYIWSFGNRGETYLFGERVEKIKEKAHDYVVFDVFDIELEKYIGNGRLTKVGVKERRLEFCKLVRENKKRFDLEPLQQLEHLERLERLQQLEHLERLQQPERLERLQRIEYNKKGLFDNNTKLTLNTGSYLDYKYQKGDVVYCDIPYKDTAKYNKNGFDHEAFYKWALSRDYTVYISSYEMPKEFTCVYEKQKRSLLNSTSRKVKTERLYTNK